MHLASSLAARTGFCAATTAGTAEKQDRIEKFQFRLFRGGKLGVQSWRWEKLRSRSLFRVQRTECRR